MISRDQGEGGYPENSLGIPKMGLIKIFCH